MNRLQVIGAVLSLLGTLSAGCGQQESAGTPFESQLLEALAMIGQDLNEVWTKRFLPVLKPYWHNIPAGAFEKDFPPAASARRKKAVRCP